MKVNVGDVVRGLGVFENVTGVIIHTEILTNYRNYQMLKFTENGVEIVDLYHDHFEIIGHTDAWNGLKADLRMCRKNAENKSKKERKTA